VAYTKSKGLVHLAEAAYDISNPNGVARLTKRSLMLRDSVVFLTLLLITAALYVVTLFLFRSFESHRQDLARDWAARGTAALQQNQPAAALSALRAALSYSPDNRDYQLLLAQALAESGRTEEATNYFLGLWSARPGDGFVNLQLARLARKRKQFQQADNYYRAAIYGDWQGDGALRRRETRIELADYLAQQGNRASARNLLLVAAGNAPDTEPINLLIADKLISINAPDDALTYYQRAVTDQPNDYAPAAKAGITAYRLGDYETAHTLLTRAEQLAADSKSTPPDPQLVSEATRLNHDAARMLELSLSRELPAVERARHIRLAASVVQERLKSCTARATLPGAPLAFPVLNARWNSAESLLDDNLANNAAAQDSLTQLIYDTELQTASVCGPPASGDDALLLLLAHKAQATPANGASR
jgi:tetratricopeptide (TPR) repeat protein